MTTLRILSFLFFCYPHSLWAKLMPISINNISNINFETVVQGDNAILVPPSNVETPTNASFDIRGDKNRVFYISLPTSTSITLNGQGRNPIQVSNFKSFPDANENGKLDNKGRQTIFVGATLGPVSQSQPIGSYSGTFNVEVIY